MHATIRTGTNGTIDTRGPGSHGKLKENKIIIKKRNSGKKTSNRYFSETCTECRENALIVFV